MIFCPYCGKKLVHDCNFCPYCGKKLQFTPDVYSVIDNHDPERFARNGIPKSYRHRPAIYGPGNEFTVSEVTEVLSRQCVILQAFIDNTQGNLFYIGMLHGLFGVISRIGSAASAKLSAADFSIVFNYCCFLSGCIECLEKEDSVKFAQQIDTWINELDIISDILDSVPVINEDTGSEAQPEHSGDFCPEVSAEIENLIAELREFKPSIKRSVYDPSQDYHKELCELTGLESVKTQLDHIIRDFKLQNERKKDHPDLKTVISTNFIFKGRPGTGKTTVARLIAGILKSEGIVENGCCVETDASSLVSAYVGVPSKVTKLAALQAIGGVLFIDEAYSLMNHKGGKADIGAEIIDTLTPLMENYRDKLIIILAGYNDEMDRFLASSNTGFPSRFKSVIDFEDYNPDEMMNIFLKISDAEHYRLEDSAMRRLYALLQYIHSRKDSCRTFANARTVRSLYESIRGKASVRMSQIENSDYDLIVLEDVTLTAPELKAIGAI